MLDKPKPLIFLHISKAGGTTLRSIIQNQYEADKIYDLDASYFTADGTLYDVVLKERFAKLTQMTDTEKASFDCFLHPIAYGLHEILPRPAQYLTMLRDPIDHYISNYYFTVNKTGHIHHEYVKENNVTLDNYHEHFSPGSFQTRCLSGYNPLDGIYNLPPIPDDALEKAKENLRKMAVVGLMEEYDLSLLMMQQTFSWKDIRYQAKNVAPSRKKISELNPKTREILEDILADDIVLYAYAKDLFEEQKQRFDIDWDTALSAYQQANVNYRRIVSIKTRARKMLPSIVLKALGKK